MIDLIPSFAVTRINALCQNTKLSKSCKLSYMGNLILDSGWKSLVELMLQSTIAPTMNLGSKLIEFHNVSGNLVRIPHL